LKNKISISQIIVASLVVIILGLILLMRLYSPKYTWYENLNVSNKQPYGLSTFNALLSESYTRDEMKSVLSNNFNLYFNNNPSSDYLFIGTNYWIDSANTQSLIQHISKGNKAFIATSHRMNDFINSWLNDSVDGIINYKHDTAVIATMIRPDSSKMSYNYKFRYLKKTEFYNWNYFTDEFFDLTGRFHPVVLSTIGDENHPNFISLKIGRGSMYLMTTPMFFSNYYLDSLETFNHLQETWSIFNPDDVLWDKFSASPYNKPSFTKMKESPLRYILKNRSLRWAWYLIWITLMLYVVFQSRRKQQVIPLQLIRKNNTIEYSKAIAALYFQGKNHKIIAEEMLTQFYSFIRNRYNIRLDKDKNEQVEKLSVISGINKQTIHTIFRLEIKLKFDKTAESEQLALLYNSVDYFYKNCK